MATAFLYIVHSRLLGVDLKGKDSVPDTVDHAVVLVDPSKDYADAKMGAFTDAIHKGDKVGAHGDTSHLQFYPVLHVSDWIFLQWRHQKVSLRGSSEQSHSLW
jgi:hypothetical protein